LRTDTGVVLVVLRSSGVFWRGVPLARAGVTPNGARVTETGCAHTLQILKPFDVKTPDGVRPRLVPQSAKAAPIGL
jgi:hypothetical protein